MKRAKDETPPPPFSSRVSVDLFGLTDMIDNVDIELILNSARSAKSACRSLADLALKNGGRDNVTVIVARYSIA